MSRLFDTINLAIILALTASSSAFATPACCTNDPLTVPEPASIALLAVGVGGVLLSRRRSRTSRVISTLAIVAAVGLWMHSGMADQCVPCNNLP